MIELKIKNFGPIKDGHQDNEGWLEVKKVAEVEQRQVFVEIRDLKLKHYGFYEFIMNGNYLSLVS